MNTTRASVVGDPNLPNNRSRADLIQRYFNPDAFVIGDYGFFGLFNGRSRMHGHCFIRAARIARHEVAAHDSLRPTSTFA